MKLLISLSLMLLIFNAVNANHFRGGYIRVSRVDNLSNTVEITFTGFRTSESGVQFGPGTIDFGDGSTITSNFDTSEIPLDENIIRREFTLRHDYSAPGQYTISFTENSRGDGLANVGDNQTFRVETTIIIDPFLGLINSGVVTTTPIFEGTSGELFTYNPGVFDVDGDLIRFEIETPLADSGDPDDGYVLPIDRRFYLNFTTGNSLGTGVPSFSIDPFDGTLTWDAPGEFNNLSGQECSQGGLCANYSIAFSFSEFRSIGDQLLLTSKTLMEFQVNVTSTTPFLPEEVISIFPNPTQDVLNIGGISGEFTAELISIDGRFIRSVSSREIQTSDLSQGIYLIKVNDGGTIETLRFLKN